MLTPEAFAMWREFAQAVEVELREGGEFETLRDWAGKCPGAAARLAGLMHIIETDASTTDLAISGATMERALTLAARLTEHAKATFQEMGADPDVETAKGVLCWIKRERPSEFAARDCYQALKGRCRRMDLLRPAFSIVEDHGHIRLVDALNRGPGRPSARYAVNPIILGGE